MLVDHTQRTPESLRGLLPLMAVGVRPDIVAVPGGSAKLFYLYEHQTAGYVRASVPMGRELEFEVLGPDQTLRQARDCTFQAAETWAQQFGPLARQFFARGGLPHTQELWLAQRLAVRTPAAAGAPVLPANELVLATAHMLVSGPAPGVPSCLADGDTRAVLALLQAERPTADDDSLALIAYLLSAWSRGLQDGLQDAIPFYYEHGPEQACRQLSAETLAYLVLGLQQGATTLLGNQHPLRFTVADLVYDLMTTLDLRDVLIFR